MANVYLLNKWKLWFKLLDRKHAGKLTQEDEKREEETYVKLAHLEGESKAEAMETFHALWNDLVFHGKPGPVTEQEFLDLTNDDYKSDKGKFTEKIRRTCVKDLKIVDQSKEGSLTEEEFTNVHKAFGLVNEEWNKTYFNAFNPVDGKVPTDVLCDAWVQFFVNGDSSQEDIVREKLETYPDI